jgi:hypothetical protein
VVHDQAKVFRNTIRVLLWVVDAVRDIQAQGGFGSIKLDLKEGLVVYTEKTVREHLN